MADLPADRSDMDTAPAPFLEPGQPGVRLPVPLTSFVGRQREIDAVAELLLRPPVRLVTLTGPGGVGKTRLAIRVADDVAGHFPDGTWFIALASVRDASLVATTIANALDVRATGSRSLEEGIRDILRGRRTLLILDNFEQVLAAAPLVADLLAACPSLTVLVTSRAVLHLSGEHNVVVSPLGLPDPGRRLPAEQMIESDAALLFVERAEAARAGFAATTGEDAAAIAEICRRLDGLPLAIELAAARVRHLPPPALLARLQQRLPLLTGGSVDQPARQQTMRDAIAWSYELLDPVEQTIFRRLAVFSGGFDLEAGAAVVLGNRDDAGDTIAGSPSVIDGVLSLADKSLVRSHAEPDPARPADERFDLLETIREFGWELLLTSGEMRAVQEAHGAYFLALAERIEPPGERESWYGDNVAGSLRLEADHDNLRAALAWFGEQGRTEEGLRLAGALGNMWFSRGYSHEGIQWLERFLAADASSSRVRMKALIRLAGLAVIHGDDARTTWAASEGLALARRLGERASAGIALLLLAGPDQFVGEYARAEVLHEEALALFREVGNASLIATQLTNLAIGAYGLDDPVRARALVEEALPLWREIGNDWGLGYALRVIGDIACDRGEHDRAAALYAESLSAATRSADRWATADTLTGYAYLALSLGRLEMAARLFGAAEPIYAALGLRIPPTDRPNYPRAVAAVHAGLGDAAHAAAWAAGRELSPEQAVAEAVAMARAVSARREPSAPPPTEALGLTPRETEVLRLLADGMSDREIAVALFISPKTVGLHVSNLLGKLGVPSRAAAIAYIHRHGLA